MPTAHPTVLVLEDDPDILEVTRAVLEDEGYAVLAAHSDADALQLSAEKPPHTVLLDLSATQDAPGLVARLRERSRVLLFSAGHGLAQRARELGAHGSLAKPFEIDELLAVLGR